MANKTLTVDKRTGWRSIESAPKDGTSVLLFGDGEVSVAFWEVKMGIGEWRCIGYGILGCEDNVGPYCVPDRLLHPNPTHWMPLPDAP